MTSFEWLAVAYFVAIATAARRAATPRRALLYAGGAVALIIVARFTLPWSARAWMPVAYLLLGYWIPAAFAPPPSPRFERWLALADARVRARVPHLTSRWCGLSDAGREVLELSYLLCYPLVPAAFAVVVVHGSEGDVERFWLGVLAAGYMCYGTLPWTTARPPWRMTGQEAARLGLARVNVQVLGRLSHQFVTFPSGHVAVATAAALGAARVSPAAGAGLGVLVALIAVAAVAGRYHYLVDVLLGLFVGAVVPRFMGS
ncbi:MAG: phosphatase PAP2 family protein [Vicinamibacterales bacterium]